MCLVHVACACFKGTFTLSLSLSDSPFPDGNPDSLSPSSSFTAFTKQQETSSCSSAAADPSASASHQESVIVIDEAVPRESPGSGEDGEVSGERDREGSHPLRPPSPTRTSSITDEEALGEYLCLTLDFN